THTHTHTYTHTQTHTHTHRQTHTHTLMPIQKTLISTHVPSHFFALFSSQSLPSSPPLSLCVVFHLSLVFFSRSFPSLLFISSFSQSIAPYLHTHCQSTAFLSS